MLEVAKLQAGYGKLQVLFDVSFTARPGEVCCLLGRNGAGKTTTMKAIMGLVNVTGGSVSLENETLSALPAHEVPRRRVGYVPQGRRLFTELSVAENIEIGLMTRNAGADVREWVLQLFPLLRERQAQRAETLSGGEQQMLATARALCVQPRVLLLDEPTEGLQPSMIDQIRQVITRMKAENVAVVLVEQRIDAVFEIANQIVFLENGRTVETTTPDQLKAAPDKLRKYLGV